jgi:predicted GNAT family acetyltransferase
VNVIHNPARHRFEAEVEGQMALLTYLLHPGHIVFNHTEVPEALEGQGLGSRLAQAALDYVTAQCPFVAAYIARHPEYSTPGS